MTTTILVTGGCGFIGKKLVRELIKNSEYKVIVLNVIVDAEAIIKHVIYYEMSTFDINKISEIPDIIIHLGEYARIRQSFEEIYKCFESNQFGTFHVLEYARKHKCKLIYGGSSSKFSNNGKDQHLSPYSWTKAKNCELIKNYGDWYGLNWNIVYFYNVYGAGQIEKGFYATVIGIFCDQFMNRQPITIIGDGQQSRDFTHIDDVIDFLLLIIEKTYINHQEFHIGSGKTHKIIDVAHMFTDNIQHLPISEGERVSGYSADITTCVQLGWNPKRTLEEYISSFLDKINHQ